MYNEYLRILLFFAVLIGCKIKVTYSALLMCTAVRVAIGKTIRNVRKFSTVLSDKSLIPHYTM